MAACTNDVDYSSSDQGNPNNTIGFQVLGRNSITRAQSLQDAGHYNFGVFAYKSSDNVNNVMSNYLVGYMDDANKKGYYMTSQNQTTEGDNEGVLNGKSRWAYEMLGNKEYDYRGTEGYYTVDDAFYMSNVEKQYLRYWDNASTFTNFYAYAPYVNRSSVTGETEEDKKQVKYENSTQQMTFPATSIKAGYDDPSKYEFMYAANPVANADYGHDVSLNFKRINAKVQIKFWEDIDGYSVRILDLSSTYNGVYAAPAKRTGDNAPYSYSKGKYVKTTGATVDFKTSSTSTGSNPKPIADNPIVNFNNPEPYGGSATDMLKFKAPAADAIGTTRLLATASPTVYYAIPKNNSTGTEYDCGFTFHVTYELISTTGERIKVNDATVHVPSDVCNWESNTSYTYIFRITKNSNGTTVTPGENDIDPTSPGVTTEEALYPIVFDNCTVTDYVEDNSDWNITDGTNVTLYSVVLNKTSINNKNSGEIAVSLQQNNTNVSGSGTWSVTGPEGVTTLPTVTSGTIEISTNQKAGIYTVTYMLSSDEQTEYPNQPKTYSAQFEVVQDFEMTLSTTEIGTGGKDATNFTITTTDKVGGRTLKLSDLSIEYPSGLSADQKSKVNITKVSAPTTISVAKDATPGTYTLKYGDGSAAETKVVQFTVTDFGFTLSQASVGLSTTDQTVSVTGTPATSSVTSTYSITPSDQGVTFEATTGEITVTSSATAQTYIVTRTVTCGTSTTTYERPLEVQNVYVLSLDKDVVDNDDNTSITVTAKKNGTDASSSVTVTSGVTGLTYSPTTSQISITSDTPTGTYTVTLKDGDDVVKTVDFTVQD